MTTNAAYPDFEHEAEVLTKFTEAAGTFSILLKNGEIAHFSPASPETFREWLNNHEIKNIRDW